MRRDGVVVVMSACALCGELCTYNPLRVPSVRVHGHREPVCRDCMTWANAIRVQRGLAPLPIFPDAYEPLDEDAILWPDGDS